jgi:hypothetical protein
MGRIALPAEVVQIVESGEFDGLIGIIEDEHNEFKEQPYLPLNDERKMEFAKDVSALANSHEGIIVIGPRTGRPDASRPQDEVTHVSTFPVGLVNIEQYHQVLEGGLVFPVPENVDIRWYPSRDDAAAGIVAIHVPAQRPNNKPFLTTKTLNQDDRLSERYFGLFERRRANASPLSVQEVHGWLRAGRAGTTPELLDVVARLEALHAAGAEAAALGPVEARGGASAIRPDLAVGRGGQGEVARAAVVAVPAAYTPEKRLNDALEAVQMVDLPTIALVAIPSVATSFPDFLDQGGVVANEIAAPPSLRQYGFDLDAGDQVQVVEGMVRRAVLPDYKLLEVWKDGVVQFVARGDHDFLAWGRREQQNQGFRINPLVVAEVTLMFATFVERLYAKAARQPDRVVYELHLRNARNGAGQVSQIVPHELGTPGWMIQQEQPAPGSDRVVRVEVVRGASADVVAYELLREFYALFGVEANRIPYVVEVNGRRAVSGDRIVRARE